MIYVFDNSSLSQIFKSFYPSIFPSFWIKFEELIANKILLSTREVRLELEPRDFHHVPNWIKDHPGFFTIPDKDELAFVTQIYSVKHFQQNLKKKDIIQGKPHADPFVIAKAKVINGIVVMEETYKDNAAKIPNICDYFKVDYLNLEGFLQRNNCQW